MKTITILKGLPASGKSTWAREQVLAKPGSVKRVNKDELRQMLDAGHWSKGNEQFILNLRMTIISNALGEGKHVIVDDTNLDPKHEREIRALCKGEAQIIINDSFLQVPIEECIARDALRGEKSVGEKVIRDMAQRYLADKIPTNAIKQDSHLPAAYIVDIDGTLALLNGRNPFDYTQVKNDLPNEGVCDLIRSLEEQSGYKIIICSGRPETCKEDTKKWLKKHRIPYARIFMRTEGDTRNDTIIKREFLDEIVKKYYVAGVFDDRDRVVRMWRDAGLTCLQVAYGDF